jgi:hypothetical protein
MFKWGDTTKCPLRIILEIDVILSGQQKNDFDQV